MPATLGQLIRERRMDLGLTQEELAERVGAGVRQSEISRLERNRVTLPRRQRMVEIAQALDIPVGLLLARSGWVGAETIDAELPDPAVAEVERVEASGNTDLALHETGAEDGIASDSVNPRPANGATVSSDNPAILQAEEFFLADDHNEDHLSGDAWTEDDSQSLRDTVSRTKRLISQSRSRIDDAESTMVRGRRSLIQDEQTGPR